MESTDKLPYFFLSISFDHDVERLIVSLCKQTLEDLCNKYNSDNNSHYEPGTDYLGDNKESLFNLLDAFINDKDTSNINSPYNLPLSIHITTLFIGNKVLSDIPYYKNFRSYEGKEITVNIHGFVVLPNKIIGCIATLKKETEGETKEWEYIQNKFPHITIVYAGDAKPKDTNELMSQVFGEGGVFQDNYQAIFKHHSQVLQRAQTITYSGESMSVYLHCFQDPIIVKGFLKGHESKNTKKDK